MSLVSGLWGLAAVTAIRLRIPTKRISPKVEAGNGKKRVVGLASAMSSEENSE